MPLVYIWLEQWFCNFSVNLTIFQIFSYTKKKALQTDDVCLDVSAMGGPVKLFQCHGLGGNQNWEYDRQVFSPNMVIVCCCHDYICVMWLFSNCLMWLILCTFNYAFLWKRNWRWNLFVFVMPYTGCIIENFLLMLCLKSKKMKLCSYIRHFQTIIFNLFSFVSLFQMEITPAWCGIIFLLSILSFLYECGYYFSIESPPKTWNILHTSYSYVLHFSLFLVVVIFSSNFYL
jgi:hypothetical protein